ncbi:MAG: hypothetical protein ACTSWP_12245 [Candidatus Freyarchaeota archaeon]
MNHKDGIDVKIFSSKPVLAGWMVCPTLSFTGVVTWTLIGPNG